MKKVLSIILSIVMLISMLPLSGLIAFAEEKEPDIIDIDIYKAMCISGIADDPQSDAVLQCNELYNYYINENIYSPTQSFLDNCYANQSLMNDYNEWKLYSLAADPSSAVNLIMKKEDYYEALIIAMFSKATENNNDFQEIINNKIFNDSRKLSNEICKIMKVGNIAELYDRNIDIADPELFPKWVEAAEKCYTSAKAAKITSNLGKIIESANTVIDLTEHVSLYASMVDLDDATKLWLNQMWDSCGENTNIALTATLMKLATSTTGFADAALAEMCEVGFSISKWAVKSAVDMGIKTLVGSNPVALAVLTGLKAGKTICNIFFGTNDICEQLYTMECIFDVEQLTRNVAEKCKNTFINEKTKNNAMAFNYAVDCYYESIINLDIDCMEAFLDKLYSGGIFSGVLNWIYGVTNDYEEGVNALEGLKSVRQDNYKYMIGYFKNALKIYYPETFEYYFSNEEKVQIENIEFDILHIRPPGYPDDDADLYVGEYTYPSIYFEPSNTTQTRYKLSSSNPDVIKVEDNCILTAVSEGVATITVVSVDNPRLSYSKDVVVKNKPTQTEDGIFICGDFEYQLLEDGTAEIVAYNGEATELTIPLEFNGYEVSSIKQFHHIGVTYHNNVEIINIQGNIKSISINSLSEYILSSINVSNDNEYFCDVDGVLYSKNKEELIKYPSGREKSEYIIPENVKVIGYKAFESCESLVDIKLSDSVERIEDEAFAYCFALEKVYISSGVRYIGNPVFVRCTHLTDINVDANNDYYCSIEGNLFNKSKTILFSYAIGKKDLSYKVPNSVKVIAPRAFSFGEYLTEIVFSNNLEKIGQEAFINCSNLLELNIPDSVTTIEDMAFCACLNVEKIVLSSNLTQLNYGVFAGCFFKTKMIVIPNSITYIGMGAFSLGQGVYKSPLVDIYYLGTAEQWNRIRIEEDNEALYNSRLFYDSGYDNEYYYHKLVDGTAEIIKYVGEEACEIPIELNGLTVTSIADGAALSADDIVIPDNITKLGTMSIIAQNSVHFGNNVKTSGICSICCENVFFNGDINAWLDLKTYNGFYNISGYEDFAKQFDSLNIIVYPLISYNLYLKNELLSELVYDKNIDMDKFFSCKSIEKILIPNDIKSASELEFPPLIDENRFIWFLNSNINFENVSIDLFRRSVIVGYVGSTAEKYAKENNIPFVAISDSIVDMEYSGASVTLQDDLSLNFKVPQSAVDAVLADESVSAVYATFDVNGKETKVNMPTVSGESYSFTCPDIAPNMMNDVVNAKLYATIDGVDVCVDTASYSVAEYCYAMLDKTDDAELKALLVDMLNYGAASQAYTAYETDKLANSALTDEQKSFGTAENPILNSILDTEYEAIDNPSAEWIGAGLRLDENISMRFKLNADDITNLSVKVASDSGECIIPSAEFVPTNGGYYVYFNGFNAGQLSEAVYVTVYDGDTAVSNTLRYSIETYAAMAQGTDNEALKSLTNSMMKYGNSAYAYIH